MTEEVQTQELSHDEQKAMWAEVAAEGHNGSQLAAEKPLVAAKPDAAGKTPDQVAEIIARLDKFEKSHNDQYNTLAGHVGSWKRSEQEIRQLLAAATAATGKVDNAPTQKQVSQAINDPEEWAELKRQHPEWARATERGMDARIEAYLRQNQQSQIDQSAIDRMVSERVAGETAQVRAEMIDSHLDSIVESGDWVSVVKSPEFEAWLQAQKPEIQALGESSKMTDAAKLLRTFEKSKVGTAKADNLTQQRQQTLNAASSVPGKGKPATKPVSVDDMTPEQLWKYEAQQREKKKQRGY